MFPVERALLKAIYRLHLHSDPDRSCFAVTVSVCVEQTSVYRYTLDVE